MLQSYFFIPGNHPKLIEKINSIKADYIIVDMEDAIKKDNLNEIIEKLKQINNIDKIYFRPEIFLNNKFNKKLFVELCSIGIKKFVIPKFTDLSQLKSIENIIPSKNEYAFILLIENPKSLFSLKEILNETQLNIVGLGFGSHDYCMEVNMKHDIDLLHYPRFLISGLAKAYGVTSIDIASMEIENTEMFEREIKSAYDYGFDAKFIIHPHQLSLLKHNNHKEIDKAIKIIETYKRLGKPAVFKYKGKAIEAPHIKYYLKLLNQTL